MKRKMIALLMMLMLFASVGVLTSCGSSDEAGDTDNSSSSDTADYTLGEPSVRAWSDSTGNSFIEIIIPITNNSEDLLYCRNTDYKLVDKDGNTVEEYSGSGMSPLYLEPGEEGAVYHMQLYQAETPYSEDMTLSYDAEIVPVTWSVDKMTVDDLSFTSPTDASCVITGTITNDTDKDAEMAKVSILLYDKDGKIIGGAFGYGDGAIAAGSTGTFKTQRYAVAGGNANIADYKAVAYISE